MSSNFRESGCPQCRQAWVSANRNGALVQVAPANLERQASLHRCQACGSYWEDTNGSYPAVISAEAAARFHGVA